MIQNINNRSKTMFCFAILFIILFGFPSKIMAQQDQVIQPSVTSAYKFEAESTTYEPLTDASAVPNLSADNVASAALPIGFTFRMGCNDFTTFYANSNGMISFRQASNAATPTMGLGAVLAPLWADLGGNGGMFFYKTTGTAPNRVLTAEWKKWQWDFTAPAAVISFEVKIYEGTNVVEYIYNQEAATINKWNSNYMAAIGIYNDMVPLVKQLWLSSDATANPTTSTTLSRPVITKPATGQLYRFTFVNDECNYVGQTIINANGGRSYTVANPDGIRINLSGAGNMQIRRYGTGQIYGSGTDITAGTTSPYAVPGTFHGLALSVGASVYEGGSLVAGTTSNLRLIPVSSTKQSEILQPDGKTSINVIRLAAVKNDLIYMLEVKYTYVYPESNFLIDYKVTIPPGNTEQVKLAHGWDTYLGSSDYGPGITIGQWDPETDRAKPNFVVGTKRTPSYEAFQYKSGVPWDGYFSAAYNLLNSDLGSASPRPFMTFDNTINTSASTDNGIGISMDFGSTPGTYESENSIFFSCEAGDVAPTLTGSTGAPCTGTTINLNDYLVSPIPLNCIARWYNATGVLVADPTNVAVAGTYRVEFYSPAYDCTTPQSVITLSFNNACAVCYKPGVATGTPESYQTIISTLDRTAVARNWADTRTGALILESTNKGMVLTRIANPEAAITSPIEGMIVFDTVNKVIKLYNGSTWHTLTQQGCPDY
ncbi:hypothetical protein [Flavobacterium branchiicola]|uniref:IgGFc-binding protein N-terminal domain-containing protein n=1 Tax=Flavobacterium branchiicola TaxID=1114875 RepID=A0ABV9PAZ6_9FLAO|nr:hypothetical protein [Flavobacterium branchiicola]MBS7254298.1 hypothetical protein [Flavobacterium branchiicola]